MIMTNMLVLKPLSVQFEPVMPALYKENDSDIQGEGGERVRACIHKRLLWLKCYCLSSSCLTKCLNYIIYKHYMSKNMRFLTIFIVDGVICNLE